MSISWNSVVGLAHKKYIYHDEEEVNWYEASHICQVNDGRLATVTSQEENDELGNLRRDKHYGKYLLTFFYLFVC